MARFAGCRSWAVKLFFKNTIYKNCYSEDGEQYMGNKILESFKQFLYELKNLLGAAVLCSIAQQSMEAENSSLIKDGSGRLVEVNSPSYSDFQNVALIQYFEGS